VRVLITSIKHMLYKHTFREEIDGIFRAKCQAFAEEYDRPPLSISEAQLSLLHSKSGECWRASYLHVVAHAAVCGEALEHVGATRQEHLIRELSRMDEVHGVASVRGLICCILLPQPIRESEIRAMFAPYRPTAGLYKLRAFFNHVVLAKDSAIAWDPDCLQIVVSRCVIMSFSNMQWIVSASYIVKIAVSGWAVYTCSHTHETHIVTFGCGC
jgi:hypothetical protein